MCNRCVPLCSEHAAPYLDHEMHTILSSANPCYVCGKPNTQLIILSNREKVALKKLKETSNKKVDDVP